jgi:hypothetical protein
MDRKGAIDEPRAVLEGIENDLSNKLDANEPHFAGRMKKRTTRGDFGTQTSDDLEIYPLLGRHKITSQMKGVLSKYCDSSSPYSLVDKIVELIDSNAENYSSLHDLIFSELEPFLKSDTSEDTVTKNIKEFVKTLNGKDVDKKSAVRNWLQTNAEWFSDPQVIDFKEAQVCEYQTKKQLAQIIDKDKNDGRRVKTPLGYWWTNLNIKTEYGKLSIMEKAKKHLDRARQMFRAGTAMIYSGLNRVRTGNKTGNSLIERGNTFIYQLKEKQEHLKTRRSACFELYQAYTLIRFYELNPEKPVIPVSELIENWDTMQEYPLHKNWVKPKTMSDELTVNPLRVRNDEIYEQIMGTYRMTPNKLGMTSEEHKIWYNYGWTDKDGNKVTQHILNVNQMCLDRDSECKVDAQVTSDLPFGPQFIATLKLHQTMYGMSRFNKSPEDDISHVQKLIQDGTMTLVIQEPDMALAMKNIHIHFGEHFYANKFNPKTAREPEDYFPLPSEDYPFYPTGRLIDRQKPMIYKATDPNPAVGIPEEPEFWDSRNALEFLRTKTTQLSSLYIQEVNKDRQRELETWQRLTKNMSPEEQQKVPKPDLTISKTQTEWKGGPILSNWTSQNPSDPETRVDLKKFEDDDDKKKNPDRPHVIEETALIPRLGIEDTSPFLPTAASIPKPRADFPFHLPNATTEQLMQYLPLFPYGIPVSQNPFPEAGIMFPLVPETGKEIELTRLQTKVKQDIERVTRENIDKLKDQIAAGTQQISDLLASGLSNRRENYRRMLQHALFLLSAPTNEWQKQNLGIQDESHPFYISVKDDSLSLFMRDNHGNRLNPVRRGWSAYAWDEKDPRNNPRIGPLSVSHNFGKPGWQPGLNWKNQNPDDDLTMHSGVWVYRNSPNQFANADNYFLDFVGPYDSATLLPLSPDPNSVPEFFSKNEDDDESDDDSDGGDGGGIEKSPGGHIDIKHSDPDKKTSKAPGHRDFQDIRQKQDGQFIWFSDETIDTYCKQLFKTETLPRHLSIVYLSVFYTTQLFNTAEITSGNVSKLNYSESRGKNEWRKNNKALFHPQPSKSYTPQTTDSFDQIITPWNIEANHWVLIEMKPKTFELVVYDSLQSPIAPFTKIYSGLIESIRDNSSETYDKKQEWTMSLAKTGIQTDIVNCGAYTCWFASYILRGLPVPTEFTGSATDPTVLRNEIYDVLVQSESV